MSSDIRIGVSADTGGVRRDLEGLRRAFNSLGREAQRAGRVEFKPVDKGAVADLEKIAASFDRMVKLSPALRKTLSAAGQEGRSLDNINWRKVFPDEHQRRGHAATMVSHLDPGSHVGAKTPPPPRGPSAAGGGPSGGGGGHSAVVQRGVVSAGGLVKGAAGLAGIMGTMAMVGRSVDLAREEAIAQDQLLRGTGDLNREFDQLRTQVRSAGNGLGVAYTEAAGLARHFAQVSNADGNTDIGGNVRTGLGMARAYGLELSEGVSFMGRARHFGAVQSDDDTGRRFAAMIAEAIERGGQTAKAGEMLEVIANHTSTLARATLTPGNTRLFAGALADLTSTHTPGLDPEGAGSLIAQADATLRGGGGMGEAGQNFLYGAMLRENPGLDPVTATAITEQGIFGSGGDLAASPFGEYMHRSGAVMPMLSDRPNLDVVRELLDDQYTDPLLRLDAFKNLFGLSSIQQASAFYNMNPQELGGLEGLLGRAGVGIDEVSASGIQNLASISMAEHSELERHAGRVLDRNDLTDRERQQIGDALGEGDTEGLREAITKAVAVREQEANVATETRDGVAEINNTLTRIGTNLLPIITGIQGNVAAMAREVSPDDPYVRRMELEQSAGEYRARREDHVERIQGMRDDLETLKEENLAENPNPAYWQGSWERREEMIANEDQAFRERNRDEEAFYRQQRETEALEEQHGRLDSGPIDLGIDHGGRSGLTPGEQRSAAGSVIGPVKITSSEMASMERAAGGDPQVLQGLKAALALENWGFGEVRHNAISPAGARDPFQFMDATAAAYGVDDPTDFDQAAAGASHFFRDLIRQYDGDMRAALAHYNGGTRAGRMVADGGDAPAGETRQYLDRYDQLTNGGNLPSGHDARQQNLRDQRMSIDLGNTTFRLEDQRGNEVAEPLTPTVAVDRPSLSGTN